MKSFTNEPGEQSFDIGTSALVTIARSERRIDGKGIVPKTAIPRRKKKVRLAKIPNNFISENRCAVQLQTIL